MPVKFGRRCRQAASSFVKFRQAMSSFVKPLLDGAFCNFNDLRGTSLTEALRRDLGRLTPLRPVTGDETRIARLSTSAKKLSASRGRRRQLGWARIHKSGFDSCRGLLRHPSVGCADPSRAARPHASADDSDFADMVFAPRAGSGLDQGLEVRASEAEGSSWPEVRRAAMCGPVLTSITSGCELSIAPSQPPPSALASAI